MNSIQDLLESPEYRFVIQLLKSGWDENGEGYIIKELARGEIRWEEVNRILDKQNLTPLAFKLVKDRFAIPLRELEYLNRGWSKNKARNIIIFNELATILRSLQESKINVILLKGASLIGPVYPDYTYRPMRDVDLLFHNRDIGRALEIIIQLGYQQPSPQKKLDEYIDFENEIFVTKPDTINTAIELHWSLFDSPYYQQRLDLSWYWDGAVPSPYFNYDCRIFSPEAQLIYLSAHLMLHHTGLELLWGYDIAKLIILYGREMNWNEILHYAVNNDLVLPLKDTMNMLIELWNVPVNHQFLERLNAIEASEQEKDNYAFLRAQHGVGEKFVYDLRKISTSKRKIKFVMKNLFPSVMYMKTRYTVERDIFLPFYYPYRWYLGIKSFFKR